MAHSGAPFAENEASRISSLEQLNILDTLPEPEFDDVVLLASAICNTPIALVSLVDRERQWFKARHGLDVSETHRDLAFCGHAILQPDQLFVVEDAEQDSRFKESPLVLQAPHIRFYAGAPILAEDGNPLGTVCVIDTQPRKISQLESKALSALARQVSSLLKLRTAGVERDKVIESLHENIIEAFTSTDPTHDQLQQRQRLVSVGHLASGIVHDFNNLLQTINIGFQLIQRKLQHPDEVKRLADSGLNAVSKGAKLIAQLLALSKPKAPEIQSVNVSQHLLSMSDMLKRLLGKNVALDLVLPESLPTVNCDLVQLDSAVLNLVINARDAMNSSGSVTISARIAKPSRSEYLSEDDYVLIQVCDNGPGMSAEIAEKALQPFFTTKLEGKGTGLGLAQVQGFARRADGDVTIESALGEGTRVNIWLKPASNIVVNVAEAQPLPIVSESNTSVLVIDEDSTIRALLCEMLIEAGYEVRMADSGFTAIAAIDERVPDVALINCSLPRISGPSVGRMIKEASSMIKLIYMTGSGDIDAEKAKLPDGAILMRKPITMQALVENIELSTARIAQS